MKIQPGIITLARESRGYTQKQLAELIGVEQGTLSKVEKGLLEPSDGLVDQLCHRLYYPKDFFIQETLIRIRGHYRKKITIPAQEFRTVEAIMTILERHFMLLQDAVDLPAANIPKWDVLENGSPEMAAIYVREHWRIPKGRIDDVARLLESQGIIIIHADLGSLDGLSTFSETQQPLLFLNRRKSADRQRYTMAHEMGHFTLHWGKVIGEDRDIEKEANEFASEFLMPTRDIGYLLTKLNIEKLAELKRYWKTSMQSIIMKAKKLDLLTYNQSNYLFKQFSALGYRTAEPEMFAPDQPTIIRDIVNLYVNELGYSKAELAHILKLTVSDLEETYFDKAAPRFKISFGRAA